MSVTQSGRPDGIIGMFFFILLNMKVCCVFSIESPHRGDSSENKQYTIFNIQNETHPKLS